MVKMDINELPTPIPDEDPPRYSEFSEFLQSHETSRLSPRTQGHDSISSILIELAKKDKLTKQDKYWFTEKFKEMRTHERNQYILHALIENDDMFYKLLFLGGGGLTLLGAALGIVIPSALGDEEFASPMSFAGLVFIPAGITVMIFAGIMLAIPRCFGRDGIQFEAKGGVSITGGVSGDLKVG